MKGDEVFVPSGRNRWLAMLVMSHAHARYRRAYPRQISPWEYAARTCEASRTPSRRVAWADGDSPCDFDVLPEAASLASPCASLCAYCLRYFRNPRDAMVKMLKKNVRPSAPEKSHSDVAAG